MWNTVFKFWLSCLLVCGFNTHAQALPALVLGNEVINIAGHAEMLRDPSGLQNLEQVTNSKQWEPLPRNFNPGFTADALWLRLRIEQPQHTEQRWRLEVDSANLDAVSLYQQTTEGDWVVAQAGRNVPFDEWPAATRVPTFPLQLTGGSHTLYLRVQSEHAITTEFRLWPVRAFEAHALMEGFVFGAYWGVCTAVVALNLFFWIWRSDGFSGWYFFYILSIATGTLLGVGYPKNIFGIAPSTWSTALGMFLCVTPVAIAMLTAKWLDLRHNAPHVKKWYLSVVGSVAMLTAVLVYVGQYRLGVRIAQSLTLLWLFLGLGFAFWLWRKRVVAAGYYLLIFGVVDLGMLVRYLRNLGALPESFVINHAILVGVVLHLVAMSLYRIYLHNALQQALDIAEAARKEQRDFVNMVSHEFRTPLAIIGTSIQQLAANLSAPAEKTKQRCQNIRNATVRLGRLLDDYLSLDRMDSAHQPLRLQECRLFELAEDVTSDWLVGRIALKFSNLPASWVCDPDLIRVALRNLLANADRHSAPESHIELTMEGLQSGVLQVVVRDHGSGVDADELPKLFQKYFRGRASQGSPGAGLGLYLVSQIVQAHRGSVEVRSNPDKGCTFILLFPKL